MIHWGNNSAIFGTKSSKNNKLKETKPFSLCDCRLNIESIVQLALFFFKELQRSLIARCVQPTEYALSLHQQIKLDPSCETWI